MIPEGAQIMLDLDQGFAEAPLHVTTSNFFTNPVNSNGEVVVFGVAFGGALQPPSTLTFVRPSDNTVLKQCDLTYNDGPAYINNFAIVDEHIVAGISDGGMVENSVGSDGVPGYFSAASYNKYAEIDLASCAITAKHDVNYILGTKHILGRTFYLSGDFKFYEVDGGVVSMIVDVRDEYNGRSPPPARSVAPDFETAVMTGGPSIDNFFVDNVGDEVYATFSIGSTLYTRKLP